MTAQDIIDETRAIVQETDPANSHKTDAQIIADINACTLQLCSNINTLPKATIAGVVSADTISISTSLLRLDFASIYDGVKHYPLDTIDFTNFARLYPQWQDADETRPEMLVRMTDSSWMMYPYPDSTWTGKALTLIGSVLPTALTLASETPPLSQVLHPAYPHYCAWKFFLLLNNPERASAEFGIYDSLRKINTQTATSTTGSLLSLKMRGL